MTVSSTAINRVQYSWTDGSCNRTASANVLGAAARGPGNGFQFEVVLDSAVVDGASVLGKVLELSVCSGLWESRARISAVLVGGSVEAKPLSPVFEDVVEAYFVRPTPYNLRFR